MRETILYSIVFIASYLGVERFRRWSLKKKILDIPNERSSHTLPTPRGGGLIIVLVSLAAYFAFSKIAGNRISWAYLGGGFLIALISWLDDILTISFVWRFLIHSAAASLVIVSAGFYTSIYNPFGADVNLNVGGTILTFVWIVGLTNAFNFMDGIDGLAGMQAVTAGIGWFALGKLLGLDEASVLGGILAFSSLGFLLHNWSPARIFMGDVGSAFLGFSFAVLPLLAKDNQGQQAKIAPVLPFIAAALVWLFVFDAVLTFLRRFINGKKVWQAHREHIYQKLVIFGCRHSFVTCLYGSISILTIAALVSTIGPSENHLNGLIFFLVFQSLFILCIVYFLKKKSIQDG